MVKSWKSLESNVRELASAIWGGECKPDHVGGVDIDGVIPAADDIKVFIEITERRDLNKVREDVIKLRTAKDALLRDTGMYARCFCVVDGIVTKGMVEAGTPHQIKVLSFDNFKKIFFDYDAYRNARENAAFGSAVNPLTGAKDQSSYIPVKYVDNYGTKEYSIEDLANQLNLGRRIILLGEYGTGKSRCVREVFRTMASTAAEKQNYPIAMDLREAWGVKRGPELIRRHLEDLGADKLQGSALRALRTDSLILIFDGFDELGSQAWSSDTDKLRAIRAKSLEGVKHLISSTKEGVLITGREHYFNNNDEMFSALGLSASSTLVIRCKSEFTEQETVDFFKRLQEEVAVPEWLPRRPLICQTIADLSSEELDRMFGIGQGEVEFFDHFIHVLCERDARIHPSFDATTIENILTRLSRLTRTRPANVGPVTLNDVQNVFESIVGQTPVEDAAVMLQRMFALGRVRAESNDRQFIDTYILDGLRAKDIANSIKSDENSKRLMCTARFANPLDDLGQRILANHLKDKHADHIQFASRALSQGNVVLCCDIVASTLRADFETYDFKQMVVTDGHFLRFDMSRTLPISLQINSSVFGDIKLPAAPPAGTTISNSLAERIFGVSSASALPSWLKNVSADQFDSVESVSRIREIGLPSNHEVLATIVRKTFFQKGTGRKEEALLRGLSRLASQADIDKVLNLLLKENVLSRFRGDEGWVYTPNRVFAGRMKQMLYELKVSKDPIWTKIGDL